MITNLLKQYSNEIKEEVIKIRREIHMYPEPGYEEYKTSKLVADKLNELGLEVTTGISGTGVTGLLKGSKEGKTIMLRADMDCLNIQEQNNVEYKSTREGLSHMCGHDAHVAIILGCAMVLTKLKDKLNGNVLFLFQPAEELPPGGASKMIEEGVIEKNNVSCAIAGHMWDKIKSGKIGLKYGSVTASPDQVFITIKGKGGHAAQPNRTIDPLSIACQVYMALQTIVSRKLDPVLEKQAAVLSITMINAGVVQNVIADNVEMSGTCRVFSHEMRNYMEKTIEQIVKGICEAHGADYEFEYRRLFPPVINNSKIVDLAKSASEEIIGSENIIIEEAPEMIGEDFSYFLQKVDGVYIKIGTYNKAKDLVNPLHTNKFNIDEDVIPDAISIFCNTAIKYLNKFSTN